MPRKRIYKIHYQSPHYRRDFSKLRDVTDCGVSIPHSAQDSITEDPLRVTCGKCRTLKSWYEALPMTPEGEKLRTKALLQRVNRL